MSSPTPRRGGRAVLAGIAQIGGDPSIALSRGPNILVSARGGALRR